MFKLRQQFFIVMLIMSCLLTAGLYFYIKYSFKQDFWRYVENKEVRFTQELNDALVGKYQQEQNWAWINGWEAFVVDHIDTEPHEPPVPPKNVLPKNESSDAQLTNGSELKPRDMREWHEQHHRPPMRIIRAIFLLDKNHHLVAGNNAQQDKSFLIAINNEGNTIGYLGIPFNPALRDLQDSNFAQLQEQKLALTILLSLLFASLVAIPLAHILTRRINKLMIYIAQLSKGKYDEKILIKGKDEINELAEHLNSLSDTLAHTEQTRRQWVADISHELRTPLAVLQAELEAMEDGVRVIDRAAIQRLSSHTKRLKYLVNDLYELSLTDIGGMTYSKSMINIAHVLQESISAMQPQFAQQGIQLTVNIPTTSIHFLGDQIRLHQLFTNLLKNSCQYTNSPGETNITLTADTAQITITIEDTAPGVADEHLNKLFDRLYRADSSRNRMSGGAGLGLSICKNIVTAHDGQINVYNSNMGGLKITLHFPH